jgi:cytochrome c biogenesis protein
VEKGSDTLYNTWVFLNFPEEHQDARNGYKVVFEEYTPRYVTGIKIAKNPGTPFIWLGFALMTLGIFLVFYFPHKSFWIFVEPCGEKTARIVLGGALNRPASLIHKEFARKSSSLQHMLKEGIKG